MILIGDHLLQTARFPRNVPSLPLSECSASLLLNLWSCKQYKIRHSRNSKATFRLIARTQRAKELRSNIRREVARSRSRGGGL